MQPSQHPDSDFVKQSKGPSRATLYSHFVQTYRTVGHSLSAAFKEVRWYYYLQSQAVPYKVLCQGTKLVGNNGKRIHHPSAPVQNATSMKPSLISPWTGEVPSEFSKHSAPVFLQSIPWSVCIREIFLPPDCMLLGAVAEASSSLFSFQGRAQTTYVVSVKSLLEGCLLIYMGGYYLIK